MREHLDRADRMQGLEVNWKKAPNGKGRERVDDAWIHDSMCGADAFGINETGRHPQGSEAGF